MNWLILVLKLNFRHFAVKFRNLDIFPVKIVQTSYLDHNFTKLELKFWIVMDLVGT